MCNKCKDGYVLINQSSISLSKCVPVITGCTAYDTDGFCSTCGAAADGAKLIASTDRNVCLKYEVNLTSNCAKFARNDANTCLECKANTGHLADKCEIKDPFCLNFDTKFNRCTQCKGDYILTHKGVCVRKLVERCSVAFNSTTCLECVGGATMVRNADV